MRTASPSDHFASEVIPEIKIPPRVLMGAGPSASYPEALRAMSANTLGHLDPEFIGIMNNVGTMLRHVFCTRNPITGAVSATGTAGMEAALCNLIEPGDEVLVCNSGYFSDRMKQMATRMGAVVHTLENPWGIAFRPAQIEAALAKIANPKVLAVVHAETSTGTLNPVDELGPIAHKYGALLVVDAVTSLAGCPLLVDDWEIDACFSGTQKCISSPPGLSPITFSQRAMDKVHARKTPVQSWYFDMSLVETYWGDNGSGGRAYHHTAPSNALFGLHEALRLTLLEGLENRWERHRLHSQALMAGLQQLQLKPSAEEGFRLWQAQRGLHSRRHRRHGGARASAAAITISKSAAAWAITKGRVWRIGVMGYSAQRGNIRLVLSALEEILSEMGHKVDKGSATDAAQAIYQAHDREKTLKNPPIEADDLHGNARDNNGGHGRNHRRRRCGARCRTPLIFATCKYLQRTISISTMTTPSTQPARTNTNRVISGCGFHHIAIRTANWDKSLQFWTQAIGFVARLEWGEAPQRGIMLDTGDGTIIWKIFEREPPNVPLPEGCEAPILHFCFRTDDCAAAIKRAREYGAKVTVEPKMPAAFLAQNVEATIAFIEGPDGELCEFFQCAEL